MHCSQRECNLPGDDETYYTADVYGREVKLPGCPVQHLSYADAAKWLSCYRWLNVWHTTPMQMGLDPRLIDPRWPKVMELIHHTLNKNKPES